MCDKPQVETELGFSTSVIIPPRPTIRDPRVEAIAVAELTEQLLKYLQGEDPNIHTVEKDAREIIQNSNEDGFALAKQLEYAGWEPDCELVNLLDGVTHIRYNAVKAITQEWVKEFNIKPPLPFETSVTFGNGKSGVLKKITPDQAKYHVLTPDNRTFLVPFEDVKPI